MNQSKEKNKWRQISYPPISKQKQISSGSYPNIVWFFQSQCCDFEKDGFFSTSFSQAFGCKKSANSLSRVSVNDPSTPPAPRVPKQWAHSQNTMILDDIGHYVHHSGFGARICWNMRNSLRPSKAGATTSGVTTSKRFYRSIDGIQTYTAHIYIHIYIYIDIHAMHKRDTHTHIHNIT